MATSRLRWMLSQVGPKPGAAAARATLLAASDLPGPGWRVLDERTWRTGSGGAADWQRRARAAGSITAWRSFEQTGHDRWLWMQTTPLADHADALAALDEVPGRMLANLRAEVRVIDERPVSPPEPLTADTARAVEQRTEGRTGRSTVLTLTSVTGRTLVVLVASDAGEPWAWDEIGALAQHVAARLHDG